MLKVWFRELHHRKRKHYGGKDTLANTIYLNISVHRLIHAKYPATIERLLKEINPTELQMKMINQLRFEARMPLL